MPVVHFRTRAYRTALAWRASVTAVALLACTREPARRPAVADDFGDSVSIARPAARIVSLNPTSTELLFALGAGSRLVGRSQYDVHPPAARAVPDLGPGLVPNVERVLAAHPDLVVLYASADNRPAATTLRATGVTVVSLRTDRIADFERTTRLLGQLTGTSVAAEQLLDSVTATLNGVRNATASLPRPRVFLHAWESPLMTIGAGSFLSELVTIAGARNVFEDLPQPSSQVAFEEVLRRDPDALLVGPETAIQLKGIQRWRMLRAVREGRLLVFDTLLVGRPSVRLGEAAVSLARLFHPGTLP
jgi:ABC-type Fe3+-hydroxamate transport system substrate-binding protein